jgi:hypothetical protein
MMNRNSAPLIGPGAIYTVDATGGLYLEEDTGRGFLSISNGGTVAVLVGFGANPATAGVASVSIAAGATYNPLIPRGDAIWLAAASSTAAVTIFVG